MVNYRRAVFDDVEALHQLLNGYAAQGLMLARARNHLYENLRDYLVAEEDGAVLGAGALHMVWDKLGEIRSLAVAGEHQKQNIGHELVSRLEADGLVVGVRTFFAFTYQPGFFGKCGYHKVSHDTLPQKVWKECVYCPKYPYCDEVAMIKHI